MAALSAREPLLSNGEVGHGYSKSASFLPALANSVLKSLMWAIFIIWVAVIFFNPTEFVHDFLTKWIKWTRGTIFGITGTAFYLSLIIVRTFLSMIIDMLEN